MIEVFKTNVQKEEQSKILLLLLFKIFPSSKINFDLCDCDRILRAEGDNIDPDLIINILTSNGYQCQALE